MPHRIPLQWEARTQRRKDAALKTRPLSTADTNTHRCRLTSAVRCEDQKHSDEEEGENEGQTRGSLLETH